MLRRLWLRKWLIVLPAVIGAVTAVLVGALRPVRYESHTTIQIVPARIGPDYVRPVVSTPLEDRLGAIRATVTSRTRLERIVGEFNLYAEDRRGRIMEEIVDQFRQDIDLAISTASDGRAGVFRLSYTGTEPRTVMKVAEKISALFVDESLMDRRVTAEGTANFLESQIEESKKRLVEHEGKLAALGRRPNIAEGIEFDVLQSTYRSLLEKRQEVRLAVALEARQIGETFKIVNPASYPERPVGPNRARMNLMGAGAGLVMGLVLVAALPRRQPSANPA